MTSSPHRLKLTLNYQGARFSGSQYQPDCRTVEGTLSECMTELWDGEPESLQMAGRTDSGVHAAGQVAAVEPPPHDTVPGKLMEVLNCKLPADLGVTSIERVPEEFHARHSALEREYRYRIWCERPHPLEQRWRSWYLPGELDTGMMAEYARRFEELGDFSNFAGAFEGEVAESDVRRCKLVEDGGRLRLEVAADRFLYHMVRFLAGFLVRVGRGELDKSQASAIIGGRRNWEGRLLAPAHGLTLWRIEYGGADVKQS